MKKLTTLLAIVGAVLAIGFAVNIVSAGAARYSRDNVQLQRFHMEYRAIHP
jgi:hypothetical protein